MNSFSCLYQKLYFLSSTQHMTLSREPRFFLGAILAIVVKLQSMYQNGPTELVVVTGCPFTSANIV